MAEAAPLSAGIENPTHSSGRDSPTLVSLAGGNPPPVLAGVSPLGSIRNFRRTSTLGNHAEIVTITGATIADPAGAKSRQPTLRDPAWALSLTGISSMFWGYFGAFFLYWFGYIFVLLGLFELWMALAGKSGEPLPTAVGIAIMGPLYGIYWDYSLCLGGGWTGLLGLAMLVADPILLLGYLNADSLRQRLKCVGWTAALVLVKAVIYALVSRQS